jgi:hypothetical protein
VKITSKSLTIWVWNAKDGLRFKFGRLQTIPRYVDIFTYLLQTLHKAYKDKLISVLTELKETSTLRDAKEE